jgi:hypothetical protein
MRRVVACSGLRRVGRSARVASALAMAIAMGVTTGRATAETPDTEPVVRDSLLPYLDARRVVLPSSAEVRALRTRRIPGFSRQTKLACSACHYGFPQLTPFGRLFKLNGYTLTGLETINAGDTSRSSLKLAPFPPISAMAVASVTHLSKTLPGTQNNSVVFPDQLSIFLAGEITPRLGAFVQFTYAAPDGSIGIDNTEFRFADRTHLFSQELLYGVTLNNNPTMQDVWNTVPAWGFPFMSSSVAPTPTAGALIEGVLGQQVVGLGGYGLWHQLVYAEVTAYRSAQQGVAVPLDASATGVTRGVIPYWRLALQHQFGHSYVMLGTYGLSGRLYPTGVSGATDKFTDAAADLQIEQPIKQGVFIVRSTFLPEAQTQYAEGVSRERVVHAIDAAQLHAGLLQHDGNERRPAVSRRSNYRERERQPPVVRRHWGIRLQRVAEHPSRCAVHCVWEVQRRLELLRRSGTRRR